MTHLAAAFQLHQPSRIDYSQHMTSPRDTFTEEEDDITTTLSGKEDSIHPPRPPPEFDFTLEEIRQQLEILGVQGVPLTKLRELKSDLDEVIAKEQKWRPQRRNDETDADSTTIDDERGLAGEQTAVAAYVPKAMKRKTGRRRTHDNTGTRVIDESSCTETLSEAGSSHLVDEGIDCFQEQAGRRPDDEHRPHSPVPPRFTRWWDPVRDGCDESQDQQEMKLSTNSNQVRERRPRFADDPVERVFNYGNTLTASQLLEASPVCKSGSCEI